MPPVKIGNRYLAKSDLDFEDAGIAQFCIDFYGTLRVPHDFILKTSELKNNKNITYYKHFEEEVKIKNQVYGLNPQLLYPTHSLLVGNRPDFIVAKLRELKSNDYLKYLFIYRENNGAAGDPDSASQMNPSTILQLKVRDIDPYIPK